ncbi:potassium/proton antiporter [Paenibacillus sp. GCM10023252]|uniref:potassium/proton antiporter n=1 Tax=Paenibacillus sp. GCM10023252 TaxID=3252649 RepID=UPI00360DC07F
MIFTTDTLVFILAMLLITGVVMTKFSAKLGMPSLVFYVGVGMLLKPFIGYENVALTQLFGIFALIVILFDGGMQTKWFDVRKVLAPSLSLATIGVLLTTVIVGGAAKLILQVDWLEAMLFGAIVGSTDAAAVFAVLGSKNIKRRITSTLEAESGTNDPMAVFLTITLIELIEKPDTNYLKLGMGFVLEMGIGLAAGLLVGMAAIWLMNRIHLESSGLYPVLAIGFAVLVYSGTALLHGSGLLAVYVLAMKLGNSQLTCRQPIVRFNSGFAWMMQILMFIVLGLLVTPKELFQFTWQGIVLSFVLMLLARPVSVAVSLLLTRFSLKEKVVIAWAGLRGAVPIVLATYPLLAGLENGQLLFHVVFFVVLSSALIQGSTINPLMTKLGLSEGDKEIIPHRIELISRGRTGQRVMEVRVEAGSGGAGRTMADLALPEECLIIAVVRGQEIIAPRGSTRLEGGDTLYVLTPDIYRDQLKMVMGRDKERVEAG